MFFFFSFLIIAAACCVITVKTLVGYSDLKMPIKILTVVFIFLGWFAPLIMYFLTMTDALSISVYRPISHFLYGSMGFVFILFIMIMLRDIIWYAIYGIARLLGRSGWHIHPKNLSLLGKANLLVVVFSIIIGVYAFYQVYKQPYVI